MGMLMRRHHKPVVEEPVPEVAEEEIPFTEPEEPTEPVKEPVKKQTARKAPAPATRRRRTGK